MDVWKWPLTDMLTTHRDALTIKQDEADSRNALLSHTPSTSPASWSYSERRRSPLHFSHHPTTGKPLLTFRSRSFDALWYRSPVQPLFSGLDCDLSPDYHFPQSCARPYYAAPHSRTLWTLKY
jgi:hypothetical protein